ADRRLVRRPSAHLTGSATLTRFTTQALLLGLADTNRPRLRSETEGLQYGLPLFLQLGEHGYDLLPSKRKSQRNGLPYKIRPAKVDFNLVRSNHRALAPIGEHVDHLASTDRLLQLLPVIGVIQIAMQLAEQPALPDVGEQERRKLLGEHIHRPHRIPGLGTHLVLGEARRRNAPEIHLGKKADLVVVVEHHAAMTGNAEVLQQHVAWEDIRGCQLLDGQAVIVQGFAYL